MSPTIRSAKLPRWHLTWNFWRTLDSSAREAADKYTENAGNYRMDATGFSLRTEIYYLSQMRIACNMRTTFDVLAQEWGSRLAQDNSDFELVTNPQRRTETCFRQQVGICRRFHPDKITTNQKNNTRQQMNAVTEETPKSRRLEKGSPACDTIHKTKKNQKISVQNYSLISTASPES